MSFIYDSIFVVSLEVLYVIVLLSATYNALGATLSFHKFKHYSFDVGLGILLTIQCGAVNAFQSASVLIQSVYESYDVKLQDVKANALD